MKEETLYYIQDSRSYLGNSLVWWGKNRSGYTSDLNRAGAYTKKEAYGQHKSRSTDIPWRKKYIDIKTQPTVDHQYLKREDGE